MKTNLTGIEYTIDPDGTTKAILARFAGFQNSESVNATVQLTDGDLDNLSRAEIEKAGRTKLTDYVQQTTTDASSQVAK